MVCQEIRDGCEEDIFIKIKKLLKKNENYLGQTQIKLKLNLIQVKLEQVELFFDLIQIENFYNLD